MGSWGRGEEKAAAATSQTSCRGMQRWKSSEQRWDSPAGSQARSSRGRKLPASQTSMLSSQQPCGNDPGRPAGSAGRFPSLPATQGSLLSRGKLQPCQELASSPLGQAVPSALAGFPSLPLLLLQPDFYLLSSLFDSSCGFIPATCPRP